MKEVFPGESGSVAKRLSHRRKVLFYTIRHPESTENTELHWPTRCLAPVNDYCYGCTQLLIQ